VVDGTGITDIVTKAKKNVRLMSIKFAYRAEFLSCCINKNTRMMSFNRNISYVGVSMRG
jgi:hypothetical protein